MRRRRLLQLSTLALLGGSGAGRAQSILPAAETVRLDHLRLLIVRPARQASTAVVILPTIAGANPFTVTTAAQFAAEGMLGVVWDPYDGEEAPATMRDQVVRSKRITDTHAVQSLRRIVGHLLDTQGVQQVGTLGWCLGGRFGLIHAGNDDRVAAVASYNPTVYSPTPITMFGDTFSRADFPGQTMDDYATTARIRCPVQLVRPEHDICQPAEYAKLQEALFKRPQPTRYEYYPGVGHGFAYMLDKPENRLAQGRAWASSLTLLRDA